MPVDVLKAGSLSSVTVAEMSDVVSGGGKPGPKGESGPPGPAGKDGKDGKDGVPGPSYTLPAATTSALGGVKMAAKVESTGSVEDIVKSLQDAGIMSK